MKVEFQLIIAVIIAANGQQQQTNECLVADLYQTTGQYSLEYQSQNGFCRDWAIGPVLNNKVNELILT